MIDVEINSERWLSLEDLPEEEWLDIKDYEGLYQVSNYGRVKSLFRENLNNQYGGERILKSAEQNNGYRFVILKLKGSCKRCLVHRLVAEAFIPNPENKPFVLHKKAVRDGGTNYNKNLYWGTQKENMRDKKENGRGGSFWKNKFGKDNPNSKKVYQITKDGIVMRRWDSQQDVFRELGIQSKHIASVCTGKRKTAGGYIWKHYKED